MKKGGRIAIAALAVLLLLSAALNIYCLFCRDVSYLQSPAQLTVMEAGVLRAFSDFSQGQRVEMQYDLDAPEYAALRERYGLDAVAGEGTDLQRALRLMHEFAPRLAHRSDYDNHIPQNAADLLSYSLDDRSRGINCRAKAQILNEMCLAEGIFSRKLWLMPLSPYDDDCHVVNEIWDESLSKWVMLDITNDQYWVDGNGTPLSALEIRALCAECAFCTPLCPGQEEQDTQKLRKRHTGEYLYIMKNLVYLEYLGEYGVGESQDFWLLFPENLRTDYPQLLSQASCEQPPSER